MELLNLLVQAQQNQYRQQSRGGRDDHNPQVASYQDFLSTQPSFFSKAEELVAEPPELFWLKCASHRYTADTNSTHFKRNNPLVRRVSARSNHGSTGSKQVYLAQR
jgi:hypothetical protein